MIRPFDSAYDRDSTSATNRLLGALRQAGHTVECPVTGNVIVDGIEVPGPEWDALTVFYGGGGASLADILEAIGL